MNVYDTSAQKHINYWVSKKGTYVKSMLKNNIKNSKGSKTHCAEYSIKIYFYQAAVAIKISNLFVSVVLICRFLYLKKKFLSKIVILYCLF